VGLRHVTKGVFEKTLVALPPRPEQTRIADQLDTLLARVQACNDRFDAIPALLKRFRQTVLGAALNGAFLNSAEVADAGLPKVSISAIAAVGTGSTPLRSNGQFFASSGTPWVTSSATSATVVTSAHEFVTPAAIAAHRLKLYPKGTLLVAMYGEGKTRGQVAELGIEATINQACAAVVVNESKAVRSYVKLALQANYLNMRELAEGGNQPNLNLSKVKEFEIPLPSLADQTEIVRRVEALFAMADRIEARCTAARAQAQRLTPLVLAKAFRGELVPQDPNDEPASELLARIGLAKTAAAKLEKKTPIGHKQVARKTAST
jgi:type I restriction enzyme S subunit